MLEEKDGRSDIQGRIETLKSKFKDLKEPPEHLNKGKKESWDEKVRRADSILKRLEKRVKELGSGEQKAKLRIDRTLQRLGIQARSMEKALQQERAHP